MRRHDRDIDEFDIRLECIYFLNIHSIAEMALRISLYQ